MQMFFIFFIKTIHNILSLVSTMEALRFSCQSSTRKKSRLRFVIETARAFIFVGETRWPAPGKPLFSFSKRASAKKWRFGRVLRNYQQPVGG